MNLQMLFIPKATLVLGNLDSEVLTVQSGGQKPKVKFFEKKTEQNFEMFFSDFLWSIALVYEQDMYFAS